MCLKISREIFQTFAPITLARSASVRAPFLRQRVLASRMFGRLLMIAMFADNSAGSDMSGPDMELASGIAAFEAKEFARAMQLLQPLAERGDPQAQYRVAIMAQVGLGMVKNCAIAVQWMRAAAEQGYALAQHGLGFMYFQGECTKADPAEAARWFRMAADQGLAGSQATLASMYEKGVGVAQDAAEAAKWRALAEKASS
jgi:hypothetical protein